MEARPAAEPATQRALRRRNLGLVLRHVAEHGPRSRATIAFETGLNKSTISSLVGELIDLGLLLERGALRRGTVGRPGLVVDVSRDGVVALGLEINVDYLAVQATDLTGGSRHRWLEAADNRGTRATDVIERLARLARSALAAVRSQGLRPIGATVALPGLVEVERGALLVAPNLGWSDVPVVDLLRERLDAGTLPVDADNEANLGALAELWEGAGVGLTDFMYVSGEIGVGAGIVIGGELFRGYRGFGGEFGHVTVESRGRRCGCGSRGCLETRAGLEALLQAAGLDQETATTTGSGRPVAELVKRARGGDRGALKALSEAGVWLGIALGSAVNLLSPQAVVLGGYFAPIAEWLRPAVDRELEARVMGARWGVPGVLASTLGPEAAVRGAAALSLHRVLGDPGLVAELSVG
jgi:predicted NBD/HSP70 family sugar kinase